MYQAMSVYVSLGALCEQLVTDQRPGCKRAIVAAHGQRQELPPRGPRRHGHRQARASRMYACGSPPHRARTLVAAARGAGCGDLLDPSARTTAMPRFSASRPSRPA